MTTERRKWWRKVAIVSVGGTVVGGLFGIVHATAPPAKAPATPLTADAAWTRSSAPAPAVAEVERTDGAPGAVIPASAVGPVPLPALPTFPAGAGPVVPAVPSAPSAPGAIPPVPIPSGVEPIGSGPRNPDAGLVGSEKIPLPPVPALPAVEIPKALATPKAPDAAPVVPPAPTMPGVPPVPAVPGGFPALPPLPGATAEPPKVPAVPPTTTMPGVPPVMPGMAPTTQPPEAPPLLPSVKSPQPVQPMLPGMPDSGLKLPNPENTLNPPSPVAPAMPVGFPPTVPGGRETPGTTVDRPKPADPSFGSTEKFVFPVPTGPGPLVLTPRDTAMLNLKHAAAVAVIGGAMLTAEQARSAAVVPLPPVVPMVPATPVSADDKETTEKLRKDLEAANKKIEGLQKQVDKLTELLTGKKDSDGTVIPSDPGAVEEIKRLRNRIAELSTEINSLKTQTALKPAIVPEAKPKGIVRVVNEYPVEISMVINDKSHRIAPNTKVDVEVPAGDFSYQLLSSGAPATRSVIKDKETVTLRIK